MSNKSEKIRPEEIRDYYEQCHIDYQFLWGTNRHHGIHFGYHDGNGGSHDAAVDRMKAVLARAVGVSSGDRVLDVGCGVGGCAVTLARDRGARVLGVNISPQQLQRARAYADVHHTDRVAFARGDFTELPVADDSMDVIWGLESVCHADRKRAFLEEAARVLRPGGRLMVADGFMYTHSDSLSDRDHREMDRWLEGWAVPHLTHIEVFRAHLRDLGFSVRTRDLTKNVWPSSRRLFLASIPLYVVAVLLERADMRTGVQMANVVAAYYQHLTLRRELWGYWLITAER